MKKIIYAICAALIFSLPAWLISLFMGYMIGNFSMWFSACLVGTAGLVLGAMLVTYFDGR